jgi:hypothetical protein
MRRDEAYELFNEPDTAKCVKMNELSWAEHIARTKKEQESQEVA